MLCYPACAKNLSKFRRKREAFSVLTNIVFIERSFLEEATGRVLIPEHGLLLLQQVEQEEQEEEARLGGHDFSGNPPT